MPMISSDQTLPARVDGRFLTDCRGLLSGMERGLSGVMQAREKDFLTLGARLGELHDRCAALSARASEVVDMTSGRDMDQALARLDEELGRMTGVCEIGGSRDSLEQLGKVQTIIDSLREVMVEFGRIVKKLSMLGISTRIESARLGAKGRGFSTLADDVEKLAANIVTHSAQIQEKSSDLKGFVAEALVHTQGILDTQQDCSRTIFETLRGNMDALSGLSASSAALSRDIAEKTATMAENISQVVLSLQFHDIVRQQLEHVEEAVRDILAQIADQGEKNARDRSREEIEEVVAFIADVSRLQCSQLDNAGDRFAGAVASIRRNLGQVADGVAGLCDDIQGLLGQDGGSGQGALATVEAGIGHVGSALRDFASRGEGLSNIMQSVAATISDMHAFVGNIEDIGSEIELIALNASIRAAHTGEEGAALGVLASAIQGLSVEARRQTDSVAAILGEISKTSHLLLDNADSYYDSSQVDGMIGELEKVLTGIRYIDRRSTGALAELHKDGSALGGDARRLGDDVAAQGDLAGNLAAIRQALDGVVGLAHALMPDVDDHNRSERLKKLLDRYTMEAERDVHAGLLGSSRPGPESAHGPGARPALASKDDLGDNIELF